MKKIIFTITTLLPALTLAADDNKMTKLTDNLVTWMGSLAKAFFGLVLVAFFYGLAVFLFDEDKREKGKSYMLWSVIAMFIMGSIWGITSFIGGAIGVEKDQTVKVDKIIPTLDSGSSSSSNSN